MKLIAAVLGLCACAGALAAQPHAAVVAPDHGVRQAVQEFLRQQASPTPRELSAVERAELRRQLLEQYERTPPRTPHHTTR